jgi:PD-(D/E)XK nuclease superfamily
MDAHGAVLNPLSKRIIGCGLRVAGTLGNGFLEKVYENALAHELRKAGLIVEQQRGITVMYDGVMVGEYFIDLLASRSIAVGRAEDGGRPEQCASRAMPQLFARDAHALVSSHELWPPAPGGASDRLRSVIFAP